MADLKRYRRTRNIENSVLDYLNEQLEKWDWSDVTVQYHDKKGDLPDLPYILIKLG